MGNVIFYKKDKNKIESLDDLLKNKQNEEIEIAKYISQENIGKGSYGIIYNLGTRVFKKIGINDNMISKSFYKEISLINELRGAKKIIQIENIYLNSEASGYTMKRYKSSLREEINNISPENIKKIIYQLLLSLSYCHSKNIIHRDIKPGNILLDKNFKLVLCDFGISMKYYSNKNLERNDTVQTIWYRAPEILFEFNYHSNKMDIWSVGIILLEMYMKKDGLFSSMKEMDQIENYIEFFGLPKDGIYDNRQKWKDLIIKHNIDVFDIKKDDSKLNKIFSKYNIDNKAKDLIIKLLELDPTKRISASEALKHNYFENLYKEKHIIPNIQDNINLEFEKIELKKVIELNNILCQSYRKLFINRLLSIRSKYNLRAFEELFMAIKYFDIITSRIHISEKYINLHCGMCAYMMIKVFSEYDIYSDSLCNYGSKEILSCEINYFKLLNYKFLYNYPLIILTKISTLMDNDEIYSLSIYLYMLANINYSVLNYTEEELLSTIIYLIIKILKILIDIKLPNQINMNLYNDIIFEHNNYVGITEVYHDEIFNFCKQFVPYLSDQIIS